MIKISVIVPVYNVQEYLPKCLNQLLNQTLKDIEIICINDGSTDESLKILEEYAAKDSRTIVLNQENRGVAAARNRGIEIATGEYVGFCDPDDFVDLDFYDSLYKASDNAHIDIIKGNADIINFDGKVIAHQEQSNIHSELNQTGFPFSSFNWAWWSAIYKRNLLNKYEINFPSTQCLEDVAFLSKILYVSCSFKLVDNTFYHYVKRKGSLTNRKFNVNMLEHFLNRNKDIAQFLNITETSKERYLKFFDVKVVNGLHWSLAQGALAENFDHFADMAFDIFYSCKYIDDLISTRNDQFVRILKKKNVQKLEKYLFAQKPELSTLQKIFSVKNSGSHKVVTVLGMKLKIKSKMLTVLNKLEENRLAIDKFYDCVMQKLDTNINKYMSEIAGKETARYVMENMPKAPFFEDKFKLLSYALSKVSVDGLYMEFGVFSGETVNHIASQTKNIVYGFDSFEGLPEDWRSGFVQGCFKKENLPEVKSNVCLVKGWFDESLPDFIKDKNDNCAFIHIDCDLYSSTKTVFDILGDKIVAGTIIVFDEYFNYPGWKEHEFKAFQEFVKDKNLKYEYIGYVYTNEQVAVKIL